MDVLDVLGAHGLEFFDMVPAVNALVPGGVATFEILYPRRILDNVGSTVLA